MLPGGDTGSLCDEVRAIGAEALGTRGETLSQVRNNGLGMSIQVLNSQQPEQQLEQKAGEDKR